MLTNRILSVCVFFLALCLVFQQWSCGKEPICNNGDCEGMLQCVNGKCDCDPGEIKIGGRLCIDTNYFYFLALSDAGGCLPQNLVFQFEQDPSTRPSTPNEWVYCNIWYSNSEYTGHGGSHSAVKKMALPPEGLVGDKFFFVLDNNVYPSGIFGEGYCISVMEGFFTHPDTIETTLRLTNCQPADIPEAENKYRVTFVRVRAQ